LDLNNIDFAHLNLDKYLDWLKMEYTRFSRVNTLPLLESIYNDYSKRAFLVNTHYIRTRGKTLPAKIARLYEAKKKPYKKQIDELKDLPLLVIFFNSVLYDKAKTGEKYGFFQTKELENLRIETGYLDLYRDSLNNVWKPDFIEQITIEYEKSPLPKKAFYQHKINYLKETEFKYLDLIFNGNFVYNLNNGKTCLSFFIEFSRIWEIHYLETELLKLYTPLDTTKPPISLTLKPALNNAEITLLADSLSPLFTGTLEQWQNLFSNKIAPPVGIRLNPKTSNRELAFLFDELERNEFIKTNQWADILYKCEAFNKQGKTLVSKQYNKAKNGLKEFRYKKNNPLIETLITKLTDTLPDKIK